jgi:hypothetical protein
MRRLLAALLLVLLLTGCQTRPVPSVVPPAAAAPTTSTALRFEVTMAPGLLPGPQDGRLLVVLGRQERPEPRQRIGATGMDAAPVLGADATGLAPGVVGILDQTSEIFPIPRLTDLPPGDYFVQAVLDTNRDLKLPNAPRNLYSPVRKVSLDPSRGGSVQLELTQQIAPEELPTETENVKYVKLRSELLSRFHGRPIYLRAGVILPRDFERERARRYPLHVHTGGYGTRFTRVKDLMANGSGFRSLWLADDTPRMIYLQLDGAGPFGDPYQVNSANNGPYGDAVTRELIPHVEQKFRGLGRPSARFLSGGSTGGWVSLALQVFYPDYFGGAWAECPDPVDFRAFELIDIYAHDNAYVNPRGFERPSARELNGDVRFTLRHECQIENVLGRGNRWTLSGKDWGAWNAVFGPRGDDGLPRPLWDPGSGKIDHSVLEHWKEYDLRLVLEQNWKTLGPKLQGKIHIWVGEADDYFLNNAVHLLDDFLKRAEPPYGGRIEFGPRQGHTSGWGQTRIMQEMAAAVGMAR